MADRMRMIIIFVLVVRLSNRIGVWKMDPRLEMHRLLKEIEAAQERIEKLDSGRMANEKEYQRSKVKAAVLSELRRQGCRNASHLYSLRSNYFFLNDDGEVVGGSTFLSYPLEKAVRELKTDEEYSYLFDDAGAESESRESVSYNGPNPFEKTSFNATKIGQIMKENLSLAKRLYREASEKKNLHPSVVNSLGSVLS